VKISVNPWLKTFKKGILYVREMQASQTPQAPIIFNSLWPFRKESLGLWPEAL